MTVEQSTFNDMVKRAFCDPPINDGDANGYYAHAYLGRHAKFTGRKYRRGRTRCLRCGATMTAEDGPSDPDRFLSHTQRLKKNLNAQNAFLKYLKRPHA